MATSIDIFGGIIARALYRNLVEPVRPAGRIILVSETGSSVDRLAETVPIMFLFVYILFAAVVTSAFLTYAVRNIAIARGLKATPVYGRHTHTKPVPRLGGVAICLTFLLAAVAYIPVSPIFQVE